ncbi:TPR-like protein [Lepidopterella palustris CBS 459.81]|uniref:TPR-like protein n=1 Tax=Lepidopterella palustris CBS 459.81 TaxID=1314670 RepID=A0A8E2DYS7_9PEZI|nr:TPR-like protein [Lepidopterella palustris CBS 459.81]
MQDVGERANIPLLELPLLSRPIPSSTVPFRRDRDFVDRETLSDIRQRCSQPSSRTALVGLGGVGKSQLAIEYSYQVREKSPETWVFWVHTSSAAKFEEGYRNIAERVGIPSWGRPEADILRLVSSWLCDETNGRWFMILDNADDSSVFFNKGDGSKSNEGSGSAPPGDSLSDFLPQSPNGSILITSRNRELAYRLTERASDVIKVEPMDQGHALALLTKKIGRDYSEHDAVELLQALDYMPLAITQAAAYISHREPHTTISKYLQDLRRSDGERASLLKKEVGDAHTDGRASNSIIATWQMSFEHIRQDYPSAASLLSLMSLFDRQRIPELLLKHNYQEDSTGDKFEDDIYTLSSYSLIRTNIDSNEFEMHRLVQFSMRTWLELNRELETWKEKYISIMDETFPVGRFENWSICQALFPHAKEILSYRPVSNDFMEQWASVAFKIAWYAAETGSYKTAEVMGRRALEAREKMLGKEHPDTLTSISNLASVLQNQGKYKAAEEMNRRALEGRDNALGKEHPDTLTSVSNLALVLQYQGKYKAAEEMNRRALEAMEKALGKEHLDTLTSVSNLASLLQFQGNYEAAEEMNRRVLEGREKALGKEHPDTLISVSNLASVLQYQGKNVAAEEMNRRALEEKEKVLGKEHPDTLTSVSNLASVLQHQGKYKAAEEMNRQALEGREKVLGKEHPDTLTSVSNLASVLHHQGRYEAAEEMNRRAMEGREKALGKEHPDTLTSVSNLASVLQHQGKNEAAGELHRRALEEREKTLGK